MRKLALITLMLGCLMVSPCLRAQQSEAENGNTDSSSMQTETQNGDQKERDESEKAIRAVLDAQAAAWNRGDLEGYMDGYWNSPELTFFSGSTITRGWKATLERYRQRYHTGRHEMGKLDFSGTKIQILGPDGAVAWGYWRLRMRNGQQPHGLFTVVFRRFPEGWRIIHDHSSIG